MGLEFEYVNKTQPMLINQGLVADMKNGCVMEKCGNVYVDTSKHISTSFTGNGGYYDYFDYYKNEKVLVYRVFCFRSIGPAGADLYKVFSCYWQLGSRVRTETGEGSYEHWNSSRKVHHNILEAKGSIYDSKRFIETMKTEGIYLPNYSSWRQIVSAWEEGKMRRAEPVYKRRKFGCEFEFTGITRREAVNALMRTGYFRSRSHIGGGLDKYILIDRRNRKFEIVKDASIEANGSDQQVEFVTGILSFDDMNMLSNCLKAIRNAGGKVNSSCGMHVHVSADDYASGSKLRNLLLYTAGYQKLFYEAFKVPVKRQRYCKVSFGNMLTKLERTPNPTVAQIRSIWYEGNPDTSSHYNKSRYAIINLHSFFQGKGIEIRLFNGTLNTEQTKANIIFSCAMVEYAAHLKYQANLDYIHSTKEQQRKAMLFLLQEMDCRSLFLNNMVKNNMQ